LPDWISGPQWLTAADMVERPCPSCRATSDLLRRLEVRPILPAARGTWDALVQAHHYLGLRSLFGKTLR